MPEPPASGGYPVDDREARFEEFYAACARRLLTQLYLVTGDLEEAGDCLQEAFARAWVRWETRSGPGQGADAAAWVYTVAYRVAVSRFRRRTAFFRAMRRTPPAAPVAGPDPNVVAVRDALATLPHAQRAALVLHYYQGLSVDEIARTLRVTPSAVKSRLVRGRAALAPLVTEHAVQEEAHHD
jgi:RNA polymerase sigma-70 factor (ECF subfamily)